MKALRALLLLVVLLLTGCAAARSTPPAATPSPSASASVILATPSPATQIPTAYPTPAVAPQTPEPTDTPTFVPSRTPLPLPPSTATEEFLQLFFPTVIPATGGVYRPPIYPVPWSLSPYDHFYFARPIAASYPAEPEIDYLYGNIFFGPTIIHTGVDMPAPRGTSVLAAGPGTVVWAGWGLYYGEPGDTGDPYGMAVVIRHDFGYEDQALYTVYAHMEEVDVVLGQVLQTGSVVGKVGTTGNTTGPHVHFEVRLGKNDFFSTRNPLLWLAPAEGDGVLVGRVMSTGGTLLLNYTIYLKSLSTGERYQVNTYASEATINSDDYYHENVVLSDLPEGIYELNVPYAGLNSPVDIQILGGQVTYFTFSGYKKYNFNPPPTPAAPGVP
jgi:murein DD-endopeptidase MepM/ murein hydrolase activator NlpD